MSIRKPRRSLAAGQSRKERFARVKRDGGGAGRRAGLPAPLRTDAHGFADIDDLFDASAPADADAGADDVFNVSVDQQQEDSKAESGDESETDAQADVSTTNQRAPAPARRSLRHTQAAADGDNSDMDQIFSVASTPASRVSRSAKSTPLSTVGRSARRARTSEQQQPADKSPEQPHEEAEAAAAEVEEQNAPDGAEVSQDAPPAAATPARSSLRGGAALVTPQQGKGQAAKQNGDAQLQTPPPSSLRLIGTPASHSTPRGRRGRRSAAAAAQPVEEAADAGGAAESNAEVEPAPMDEDAPDQAEPQSPPAPAPGSAHSTPQAKLSARRRKGTPDDDDDDDAKEADDSAVRAAESSKAKAKAAKGRRSSSEAENDDGSSSSASAGDADAADADADAAAAESKAKAKARKASKSGVGVGSKRRRNTARLVQEAKEQHILDDHSGRSQRKRFKPLRWWANERVQYERRGEGISAWLPTIKEEEPIIQPTSRIVTPKLNKSSGGRRAGAAASKKKRSDDEDDGAGFEPVFHPKIDVFDVHTNSQIPTEVVKSAKSFVLEPISQEDVKEKQWPSAAKTFAFRDFHTGVMVLPARGVKNIEGTSDHEAFFVASCAPNSLQVQINEHDFMLSKGDHFVVPARNTYSLTNRSDSSIQLFYTLITPPVADE